jgi:hypothetical protein
VSIISDTDHGLRTRVLQEAAKPSYSVAKRRPVFPVLVVVFGLSASLAWTGFLGWIIGRTIGVW